MAREAVILHGVQKQYRDFKLGPLDLAVPAGTIVGLVGENGAGKTTTLRLLCGVSRPDAGQVTLLGGQPTDAARRRRIGVVFEDAYFFASLTARQIGKSMAGIFGDQWDAARFDGMLDRFGLDPKKKVQSYSRGMRMKLSLATALAHGPELLVLDEATAGLDPVVRGEMLDLFLEYIQDERHSILMSSHITSDLEQVADSIAYLHHGQLLFHEDKDTLLQEYGLLRCARHDLEALPPDCVVFMREGAFGCEALVKQRATVRRLLPGAVCDPAGIDDIMRYYSGRDTQ